MQLDSLQFGKVRSDSIFSLKESAALRDRFEGDVYDLSVNLDGRFRNDGCSGQARYTIGSMMLNVTFIAQAAFSGANIAAGVELRSESPLTGAIPSDVYDSPGGVPDVRDSVNIEEGDGGVEF